MTVWYVCYALSWNSVTAWIRSAVGHMNRYRWQVEQILSFFFDFEWSWSRPSDDLSWCSESDVKESPAPIFSIWTTSLICSEPHLHAKWTSVTVRLAPANLWRSGNNKTPVFRLDKCFLTIQRSTDIVVFELLCGASSWGATSHSPPSEWLTLRCNKGVCLRCNKAVWLAVWLTLRCNKAVWLTVKEKET